MAAILLALPPAAVPQVGEHQPSTNEWENHQIFGINKIDPHATWFPYRSREAALRDDRSRSPHFRSLDGLWDFRWVPRPADAPAGFERESFDSSDWDRIPVPANWETQGYGHAIYLDERYPFEAQWPRVPHDDNPVGSYRRSFEIDPSWDGSRIWLHFGGVRSAMYVWVNGKPVGYSQGAKTPAEFDITDHVRPGTNTLALRVFRWSDGSYLESQDMLRMSGIERSVYLVAVPAVHTADFFARATLDDRLPGRPVRSRGRDRQPHARRRRGDTARVSPRRRSGAPTRPGGAGPGQRPVRQQDGTELRRPDRERPALDGRDPRALHPPPGASRRVRPGDLGGPRRDRLPSNRDPRRTASSERPGHHPARRQPSRDASRDRPRGRRGHDASGHPVDEGEQHQRGAFVPLPQRSALVRPHRPVRSLRHRRGEHRVSSAGDSRGDPARQRDELAAGPPRPHPAHGRARQEPPLDHRLVAWQRGRRGRHLRDDLRLDQAAGPRSARSVRARRRSRLHRHLLPDVPADRAPRGVRRRPPREAPHHDRVRPRHGQLGGQPRRLLAGDRCPPRLAGWLHLGLGGSVAGPHRREGAPLLGLRTRLPPRPAHRRELPQQRPRRSGPGTPSPPARGQEGLPADRVRGGRRRRGSVQGGESLRLPGPRSCRRPMDTARGWRRGRLAGWPTPRRPSPENARSSAIDLEGRQADRAEPDESST